MCILIHIDSHHISQLFLKCRLSIPTLSTYNFVNSHFVNIDLMLIDKVGSWPNGNWQGGNWQIGKIPLILHSCHSHMDLFNSILSCAMVGVYGLTDSLSLSSTAITCSHKLLISPWCHEYMVHHHCAGKLYMEITNERWQIISSLVHSSLVMHCRNRLKFVMLKVTRRTASYPASCGKFLWSISFYARTLE